MEMFDRLGQDYGKFVHEDPMRRMHYAAVCAALYGDRIRKHLRVLDVGCGSGALPRLLAAEPYAARVTGFDSSAKYIAEAREEEDHKPLGITYVHAAAHEYHATAHMDAAVSVMSLPYAPSPDYLTEFFRTAYASLLQGGAFHSVLFHPEFRNFHARIGNRRFHKEGESWVRVEFLHPQTFNTVFDSHLTQFSHADYASAAASVGFRNPAWKPVTPSPEQVAAFPKGYWDPYLQDPAYALLSATKA